MKAIFILSYNRLGLDFWKNHLELDQSDKVYQFRSGQECVQNFNQEPTLVIIDDYFAKCKEGDASSEDVIQILNQILPQTHVFHISPKNCGAEKTERNTRFVCSNFNQDVIAEINLALKDEKIIAA